MKLSVVKEKKVFELSEQLNDQLSNLMNVYINNQQQNVINRSNQYLSKYGQSISKEVKTYGNIFLINNKLVGPPMIKRSKKILEYFNEK